MLTVVMITVDRQPVENFIHRTFKSLENSGVFRSERLHSFNLFNSDSDWDWLSALAVDYPSILIHFPEQRIVANQNVADALEYASKLDVEWILFLEDDINVCGSFIEGVYQWLQEHASKDYPFYALGSAYPGIVVNYSLGKTSWEYPLRGFYGTQGIVWDPALASRFVSYLKENIFYKNMKGAGYDLIMSEWAMKEGYYKCLATVPSFVQHIGMNSVIGPRKNIHTFPSFPGNDWIYGGLRK